MRYNPQKYLLKDGNHEKFGRLRNDGTIEVPNLLTLKWIPNYYYRLKDPTTVWLLHFATFIFCIFGLLIF